MYCRYITGAKKMTYLGALKTAEIGFGIGYGHMPYTSAFESASIELLNYIHSRPIPVVLRTLE